MFGLQCLIIFFKRITRIVKVIISEFQGTFVLKFIMKYMVLHNNYIHFQQKWDFILIPKQYVVWWVGTFAIFYSNSRASPAILF